MDNGATKSGYIKAWTCPHCRALNVARRCGCAASREANTHACVDLDSIALERRLVSHGRCSAALDLLAYVASRPRGRRNPHPNFMTYIYVELSEDDPEAYVREFKDLRRSDGARVPALAFGRLRTRGSLDRNRVLRRGPVP